MPSNDPEYQKKYNKVHYQDNKQYYKDKNRLRRESLSKEQRLFEDIRTRAKRNETPFTITVEDIIIPEYYPILGIKLGTDRNSAASVDRFVPELGYIKGNISVISYRANWIKNNMTLDEVSLLYQWMRQKSLALSS